MKAATKPKEWFESWREPAPFVRAADLGLCSSFVNDQAPAQHYRDAYTAGMFAYIWRDACGPCKVRLVEENFPDAQLRAKGELLDLEVTIAIRKGRPMFKEWRELRAAAARGEIIPSDTAEERRRVAREAIPSAVRRKACKHYATPPTLLVHTDDGRALSAEEMAQLTEPWKGSFCAIYLLAGIDAVRAWPSRKILRGKAPPSLWH